MLKHWIHCAIVMNYIFLLSAFLFSSGANSAILGEKECTYGPSYWCGSLKNAKSCGAVKHCIETVWEKQTLVEDNDSICSICKDMVKEAKDQLQNKEIQENIKSVFEDGCKLIPLKDVQEECIQTAEEFIPEFMEMLASQMNPQIVCATVGLCNSVRIDKLLRTRKLQVSSPKKEEKVQLASDCGDCKTFVSDIKQIAKSHSRSEILHKLLAICGRVDALSDGCKAIIEVNFPVIYDYLTKQLNSEEACEIFGFCEKMYGKHLAKLSLKSGDETCDYCEAIVAYWRETLASNTTSQELKEVLDVICLQTGAFKSECLSLVDQYYELIYDIILSEIQPKQLCEAVGLCGLSSVFNNDYPVWTIFNMKPVNHLPLIPLEPSLDMNSIVGTDEAASYHIYHEDASKSGISSSSLGESGILTLDIGKRMKMETDECILCEFVLHYLQDVLQNAPTREEIKHELDQLCTLMPHSVVETCQDYVDAYGDEIIQLIIIELDPSTICPLLHMCPGTKVKSSTIGADVPCIMCEFAMTKLEEILQNNQTEESVKHALETLCNILPKSVEPECRNFVDQYTDQIIDMLVSDLTPDQICQQLGLCDGKTVKKSMAVVEMQLPISRMFIPSLSTVPEVKSVTLKQSTACVVCEFVLSELDKFLVFPATENTIESALERICLVLPVSVHEDCISVLEVYTKDIVALLAKEIEPDVICRAIRLCKDTIAQDLSTAMVDLPADKCMICESMVDWVQRQGGKAPTIEGMILKVCKNLPSKSAASCESMVRQNGSAIAPLLEELGGSKPVCKTMNMCPKMTNEKLLGQKKCTWGPTYWCQSEWHAKACKATKHCVEKVWGKTKSNNEA